MNKEVMFSSKTDNWSTPQDLFDSLNEVYKFTLDPCADNTNYKCSKYYTKAENGLMQEWTNEIVFCNPPYGRDIKNWVEKSFYENIHNNALVVMLIPARTDTQWFHEYIYGNPFAKVKFIKGRLKFGGSKNSAPFPSMIVEFNYGYWHYIEERENKLGI